MQIQRKMNTWECRTWKQQKQPLWRHSTFSEICEKIEGFLLFSSVLYCNCNHSHQNRVLGIADIEMSKFPLFSVILTANYVTDDLNTVIFVISGSKSIVIIVLFFCFSQFLFLTGFPLFSAAILDRRYKPRMLGCNPIQRNELKKKLTKFEENKTKTKDVRVLH